MKAYVSLSPLRASQLGPSMHACDRSKSARYVVPHLWKPRMKRLGLRRSGDVRNMYKRAHARRKDDRAAAKIMLLHVPQLLGGSVFADPQFGEEGARGGR